jgi:hypothetical protein
MVEIINDIAARLRSFIGKLIALDENTPTLIMRIVVIGVIVDSG